MDFTLYILARGLIGSLQILPLSFVARLGRWGGEAAFWLDARHRRVALRNLTRCFGKEKSRAEILSLARENFRRIGESYASAIKTASMSEEQLQRHCECVGISKILTGKASQEPLSRVIAIGHFGNFELYTRMAHALPLLQGAATYRALRQPALNRLMQSLRERSGCRFFERRFEADALKSAMNGGRLLLGLLADQNAGPRGVRLPFFGHECSTTPAPAVFALRYDCPLFTAICFRTSIGRWRIEVGDEIPTRENDHPRSVEAITADMNHAFESAIRRDPANWFWVHNRWKVLPKRSRRKQRNSPGRTETAEPPSSASNAEVPVDRESHYS